MTESLVLTVILKYEITLKPNLNEYVLKYHFRLNENEPKVSRPSKMMSFKNMKDIQEQSNTTTRIQ